MKPFLFPIRIFSFANISISAVPRRSRRSSKLTLSFILCLLLVPFTSTTMAQFVAVSSSSSTTTETVETAPTFVAVPVEEEVDAPVFESAARILATTSFVGGSTPDISTPVLESAERTLASTSFVGSGDPGTFPSIDDLPGQMPSSIFVPNASGFDSPFVPDTPAFGLPRISGASSLHGTSASEFSILILDPNNFPVTISPPTQSLAVNGFIFPQDADENFIADIFVVAVTPAGSFVRNLDGAFVNWSGNITELVPAYENRQLTAQVLVPIFTGPFQQAGSYRYYLGYMRVDSNELIYTATATELIITP
jgi:hypothetical protein